MAWFARFHRFVPFARFPRLAPPLARCAELLLATGLSLGSGCTLLFDPESLGTPMREPDAAPIDEAQPELTAIAPTLIDEGEGTLRRVPVVLSGKNIAQDARVRLSGTGFDEPETQTLAVSPGGDMAAFTVSIPVLPGLGDGMPGMVRVEVIQGGGAVTAERMLEVNGLDDLVATLYGPQNDFTLDTDSSLVKPKYARIILDADLRAIGSRSLRLTATSEIVLDALLDASGKAPIADEAGVAGPGGCSGGARDTDGACPSGGRKGVKKGGGGGGGHVATGTAGTTEGGDIGGLGGSASGDATLIPLDSERGGGGGGGGSERGVSGGGGGGGGGIIELVSLGDFRVRSGARLSVQGGAGAACADGESGGGGGGGGGAILLRAPIDIETSLQSDMMALEGGAGGTGAGCKAGGAGALGRARVDAPTLPQFARSDQAYQGVVLSLADTPPIVRESELEVTLRGQAGVSFSVTGGQGTPPTAMVGDSGEGVARVTLKEGLNRVCAVVPAPDGSPHIDGENCFLIAFVPE